MGRPLLGYFREAHYAGYWKIWQCWVFSMVCPILGQMYEPTYVQMENGAPGDPQIDRIWHHPYWCQMCHTLQILYQRSLGNKKISKVILVVILVIWHLKLDKSSHISRVSSQCVKLLERQVQRQQKHLGLDSDITRNVAKLNKKRSFNIYWKRNLHISTIFSYSHPGPKDPLRAPHPLEVVQIECPRCYLR